MKKSIILSVIPMVSILITLSAVKKINLTNEKNEYDSLIVENMIKEVEEKSNSVDETNKKCKSMIDSMREMGDSEYIIETTRKTMAEYGYNIDNFCALEE